MSKNISDDLPKLIEAGIIDEMTAGKIASYYRKKEESHPNRILSIFGVIGAVLIGMGIILILAHNWDELSRPVKTILSFLPLLAGQAMVGYSIFKRPDSPAWLESSAAFLFFAIGAVVALIAQIYNIPGNLSSYLLAWMLLAIPVFFLTRSTTVALFSLIGITYYAYTTVNIFTKNPVPIWYWAYLPVILYFYWDLYKSKSNALVFFHWLVPISIATTLFMITRHPSSLMLLAYMFLFGVFYWIGNQPFAKNQSLFSNGYRIIGSLGTIGLMLAFSFQELWKDIFGKTDHWQDIEIIALVILGVLGVYLIYRKNAREKIDFTDALGFAFLLFIPIYFTGMFIKPAIATVIVNVLLLAFGIATILKGTNTNNLTVMNFGLLIIAALIITRFFDLNLSFVLRGVLFILIGLGFWYGNYHFIKQRKKLQS